VIFSSIIPLFVRPHCRRTAVLALVLAAACGGSPTSPGPQPDALTLACPANVQASSLGGVPVPVNFATPVGNGGTSPVTVTCAPASGTVFGPGTTQVSCVAADAAGRNATCGFGVTVASLPELTQTRFMTFGDSLTEGKLSLTLSLLIDSPAHSYPAKLLGKLTERYGGQQISVINEGFGGELATRSHDRFETALSSHHPEAVLLMHGVNDLNGIRDGRVQTTVDALEDLVKMARQAGLSTFVATLPPLGPGGKAGCPECVPPFNDRLRSMASVKGAILVDVHSAWGNGAGLMGADGIHPTEAGYEVIADAFFEAIRRTLEKGPAIP
jgi:lysophospholipase L1-like esterase